MKKRLCALLIALSLIMSLGITSVFADEELSGFEAAPRVVDNADIFTADEEALMDERLSEIRNELNRDIVIYTDVSSSGKERSVCAADFYEQGGYGYGEDREGVCLFICMDPDDRGWWCCCKGTDTRELYTEAVANSLDNVLGVDMNRGAYYEGISEWIENIRTLYLKGLPFAPDWLPDRGTEFVRTHNVNEPRVTDFTETLTDDQLASLESRAAEISDKYGIDIALNITSTTYGMSIGQYMDSLYLYKGYGLGDNYAGLLVTLHTFFGSCNIYTQAEGGEGLTDTNTDKLNKLCCTDDVNEAYEKAALFLETYDTMRDKGHISHQFSFWLIFMILGIIVGLLFGLITTGRAKKKMKTVASANGAAEYVVPGSVNVYSTRDIYIGSHTERIYAPERKHEDDDSGSSGKSSYSSSYESSSGSSYSGSGRNF